MSISVRLLLLSTLILFLGGASPLAAQDHIVQPADLRRDLLAANEKRQASVARVEKLFDTGLRCKASFFGKFSIEFSVGRDERTGNHAFTLLSDR